MWIVVTDCLLTRGLNQTLFLASGSNYKSLKLIEWQVFDTSYGKIASGIYSPRIKKNIGLSMILKDHWEIGKNVLVKTLDGDLRKGIINALPFPK